MSQQEIQYLAPIVMQVVNTNTNKIDSHNLVIVVLKQNFLENNKSSCICLCALILCACLGYFGF